MRYLLTLLPCAIAVGACRDDSTPTAASAATTTAPPLTASVTQDAGPRYSAWSAPVNVGTPVNTALAQLSPFITKDGLSLYFDCFNCPENVPASTGGPSQDIWVSHRASVDDPWGAPQHLGPAINTAFTEGGVSVSRDGHRMYFVSNRPGFGSGDLYVSHRKDKRDNMGWEPAENLGSAINSTSNESGPEIFADDETGVTTLYFTSNRPGGPGLSDIYRSTLQPDGAFGSPALVEELNSSANDAAATLRRDGLEIIFSSTRPGSIPPAPGMPDQVIDLWTSTRASPADPWSPPVNLGLVVNSQFIDQSPALSFDGTELYFHSPFRAGNVGSTQFDLWMTTRTKLHGHD